MLPWRMRVVSALRLVGISVIAAATCAVLEIVRPFITVRLAAIHTDALGFMVSNSDMALERRR